MLSKKEDDDDDDGLDIESNNMEKHFFRTTFFQVNSN